MSTVISENGTGLSPADIPGQIDLVISLHLHLWPALSYTIQNGWGTSSPDVGEDKRDWLAGAISDLFAQNQLRDLEDLEDVLEQVMNDEFEVVVDDGSLEEVARKIWRGVETVKKGDGSEVQSLMAIWEERKKKGVKPMEMVQRHVNQDVSDSDDSDDSDTGSHGVHDVRPVGAAMNDVDMDEAPALVEASRARPEPEVDEDGFTKVVSKKKR